MKKILFIIIGISMLFACQQTPDTTANATANAAPSIDMSQYPDALQKIFAKHGSLATWEKMKALSYEIVDTIAGNELQKIDLHNRREYIASPTFKTGYDGKDFWVEADTSYKGNPIFYHNLMFYFYAMPFVLADDGIIYSDTDTITYEGQSYPGIRISYNDGVGVSSKDEYFIHYNPETYQMEWLGYTVTYFSKEKSQRISWIRYDDWKAFNGLLLPNSMTWYKVEDGEIIEPRKKRPFANIQVSETAFPDETFAATANATIVKE